MSSEEVKEDPKTEVKEDEEAVAAAATAASTEAVNASPQAEDKDDEPLTPSSKRRFFPRVKHLLTREWENFLGGLLDAIEQTNAASAASASHKASNPWYKAFDVVYGDVAADCSIPTGKNRFHKFKDKIVELWTAMELEASDDHPMKARALEQLQQYRLACEELAKQESSSAKATPSKAATMKKAGANGGSSKRTFSTSFHPSMGRMWKHLNEGSALAKLPEPLKSLVHLRHMGTEIGAANVKSSVEDQYITALDTYLAETPDSDAAYDKSQVLVALYRLSQNQKEAKDILAAYELTVQEYMSKIDPPSKEEAATAEV